MSEKRRVKSEKEWQLLLGELNVCKKQLQSKKEALLILSKELGTSQKERDEYKLMAEQLRDKTRAQKKKYEERDRALGLSSDSVSERRNQGLANLLCEARADNKKLLLQSQDLQAKLQEAHGDIKLLRENVARRHRVGEEGAVGQRSLPAHQKEEFIRQLEEQRTKVEGLERELASQLDQQEEGACQRRHLQAKVDRLNRELNYVLGGDQQRIVDVDALLMETRYQMERIKQLQQEKESLTTTLGKYKNAMEKRRGTAKSSLKMGSNRLTGFVITHKQVQQMVLEGKPLPVTAATVSDLQGLVVALLETVHDKNLALNHQRNTNKILGARLAELESKLKTVEISGLYSLPQGQVLAAVSKLREDAGLPNPPRVPEMTPTQPLGGGPQQNGEEGSGSGGARDAPDGPRGNGDDGGVPGHGDGGVPGHGDGVEEGGALRGGLPDPGDVPDAEEAQGGGALCNHDDHSDEAQDGHALCDHDNHSAEAQGGGALCDYGDEAQGGGALCYHGNHSDEAQDGGALCDHDDHSDEAQDGHGDHGLPGGDGTVIPGDDDHDTPHTGRVPPRGGGGAAPGNGPASAGGSFDSSDFSSEGGGGGGLEALGGEEDPHPHPHPHQPDDRDPELGHAQVTARTPPAGPEGGLTADHLDSILSHVAQQLVRGQGAKGHRPEDEPLADRHGEES